MTEISKLTVWPDQTQTGQTRPGKGTLGFNAKKIPCLLGCAGITTTKHEADGATPVGVWPLRLVLYRPDRIALPRLNLPVKPLSVNDGWCDDPAHPDYNTKVSLPISGSVESMWRQDPCYDIVVVLGCNDDPVHAGKGSAIFFHLTRARQTATRGCIAISKTSMLDILPYCAKNSVMEIRTTAPPHIG